MRSAASVNTTSGPEATKPDKHACVSSPHEYAACMQQGLQQLVTLFATMLVPLAGCCMKIEVESHQLSGQQSWWLRNA